MTHFVSLTPGTDTFTGVTNDYNAFQLDATTLQSTDDGRYVAYQTDASNLLPGDSNGVTDVALLS